MSLPKAYEPHKYENKIYKLWEESGAFKPISRGGKESYSIVLPPPNANGNLHVGHSLMFALQDVTIRYQRMKGKAVLWVPGADHAGFETQVVYEKELAKQGKSRFDFSREDLYNQIWRFVAKNRQNFQSQFRRLGASVDWENFTFTLDKNIVQTAYCTFKMMWKEGLIYRGERLVNFCTFHGTAFADIEVEYKEKRGHLWYIDYPLTDGSSHITVATTRPETMLGDAAVAVNPKDKRLKNFVGKSVKLPLTNREIPVIADNMVNMEFGTGAVKITPAHDPNDYEVAQRHDLPMITVITHMGEMSHGAGESYRGMTIEAARKKVINDLQKLGYLRKTEDYTHSVGHCYKCGTVIQPLLRQQWFVDMKPLAKKAITALKNGQITFYPTSKQDQLISYLEGLRDWNISRQIAWGIPIPAFQNLDDPEDWIYDERVNQEIIEINGQYYKRDPDVFDTWFSSSSWPYATLGYPDSHNYKTYYPNSLMETGGEILYQWVARMIMLGLYVTGKIPFKTVYIHGYVLAEDGSKMSKSLGNVIDPMAVIDQHGSDALRMGLIAGRAPGINRGFDLTKVEGARNFCNKLWNIARYIQSSNSSVTDYTPKPETSADHWVLRVLQHTAKELSRLLDDYRYAEAYELLYHMIWDNIADWYIEASKNGVGDNMLPYVLESTLKLAHPFAPFVTETIWQSHKPNKDNQLIIQQWPNIIRHNVQRATEFEEIKEVVLEVRHLTTKLKLNRPILLYTTSQLLSDNARLITKLARIGGAKQAEQGTGIRLLSAEAWIQAGSKQFTNYRNEVQGKINKTEEKIAGLETRLANKHYVTSAPEHIVQQTKNQLAEAKTTLQLLKDELRRFS